MQGILILQVILTGLRTFELERNTSKCNVCEIPLGILEKMQKLVWEGSVLRMHF